MLVGCLIGLGNPYNINLWLQFVCLGIGLRFVLHRRKADLLAGALVVVLTFGAFLNAFNMIKPVHALQTLLARSLKLPSPGPDEACVRVEAIGLNFADIFACVAPRPLVLEVGEKERAPGGFPVAEPIAEGRHAQRAAWKVGWTAYRNGRFDETVSQFEQAVHVNKSNFRFDHPEFGKMAAGF